MLQRSCHLAFSAHRFFIWAQHLPDFKHTKRSYHILVYILGSSKQFPLLWDFLAETKRGAVFEIEFEIFSHVIRAYCRADLPADAIRAYNKMVDFGIKPDIDYLNKLLYFLCKGSNVKHAQEFFDKVKDGFVPDEKSYSLLMNGWGKVGEFGRGRMLFDEMVERGCSVGLKSYNSLLYCLGKGGNVEEAYKLFTEMKSMGITPDERTFSPFLHAACDMKDMHLAFRVLDRMKSYNLVPDVFIYNRIIRNLCRRDLVDDAYKLLNEMIELGARPDLSSYSTVLQYHFNNCEVNGATKLISMMEKESCKPDRRTYNMVLKLLMRSRRVDRAQEVWDSMKKRGFYPGVSTYSVMIHGFLKIKLRVTDACEYFEKMIDEGLPPHITTCNDLRNTLIIAGFHDQIDILAEKMERSRSRSIQELSSVMRGEKTYVASRNEEPSYESDYSY